CTNQMAQALTRQDVGDLRDESDDSLRSIHRLTEHGRIDFAFTRRKRISADACEVERFDSVFGIHNQLAGYASGKRCRSRSSQIICPRSMCVSWIREVCRLGTRNKTSGRSFMLPPVSPVKPIVKRPFDRATSIA